jgi:putative transposase
MPHRKTIKHYHEPGDFHELTFSCYRQMPLLTNDAWRAHFARGLDAALEAEAFHLVAFVLMPEHVHLLVWPTHPDATAECISRFLAAVKVYASQQVKADLERSGNPAACAADHPRATWPNGLSLLAGGARL